jgi:death-on-curing protein
MSVEFLTLDQVIRIHHELMLEQGQQSILISPEKLEAAVLRPAATVFGEEAYPRLADKAAALLESLAIGHPFMDGNKRIAFAAMETFLRLNRLAASADEDGMYELVLAVAAGAVRGVETISARLLDLYGPQLEAMG